MRSRRKKVNYFKIFLVIIFLIFILFLGYKILNKEDKKILMIDITDMNLE